MSSKQREIYATYGGLGASDLARIMSDRNLNPFTQAELLASALAMPFKETGRAHYRALVQEQRGYPRQIAEGLEWLKRLGLERSLPGGLDTLPRYTFALELQFVLARPYLSQDDDAFYIINNPVRKDKVFKVPCVAPTSWKGSLRAAATRGLLTAFAGLLPAEPPKEEAEREALLQRLWTERARRVVLFGNEKENEAEFFNHWLAERLGEAAGKLGQAFEKYLIEHGYRTEKIEGRQGRLFCFPTFFNQIGLEIINPHDRKRRVGKNPILFECVPIGATGRFTLLYVPFDQVGKDEEKTCRQVAQDLPLLAEGVQAMFTLYGFGAKTSSGFGLAKETLVGQGELILNTEVDVATSAEEQVPAQEDPLQQLAQDIEQFLQRFGLDEFPRWTNAELTTSGWGKKRQSEYKRLRNRHPDWDASTGTWRGPEEEEAPGEEEESPPAPLLTGREFGTFAELVDQAKALAQHLNRKTGGAS